MFVVEGRDLRYGVICILCAGEVVELLIGLSFKSLEDGINCKLYNKTMNKRRALGFWVRADKIDRYYRTTDKRYRETLELPPSNYSST